MGKDPIYKTVSAEQVVVDDPPQTENDVLRKRDIDELDLGIGEHDHAGDTLVPDRLETTTATVESPPESATDVARLTELDAKADQSALSELGETVDLKANQSALNAKADQNGAGTATLSDYASIDTDELSTIQIAGGG